MTTNKDIELEQKLDEIIDARLKKMQDESKYAQDRIDKLTDQISLARDLKKAGDDLLGLDEAALVYQQDALKLEERIRKLLKDKNTMSDEKYKKDLKQLSLDKERLAVQQDSKNTTDGILKSIFGISDGATLFGQKLLNPAQTLAGMKDSFSVFKNPKAIFGAIALNSLQLAYAQDKAAVSFNRATGQAGSFNSQIAGLERSLFTAGISSEEAGQAVQSLFLNMTEFTEMSKREQESLGKTVAILNELGVSTDLVTKNLNFATKAMGMNAAQAEGLQRELFTFAQDLGVSANKIASDFAQFGDEIAALGANGVDAFRDLQVASKSLGMEMGDLLNLTKQFDRFDTAAESVGRLNALLGGPFLNSVQMVSVTDPTERLRLLKQGIDRAGISFDQMDYYQRKALASATGLGEAQLAMLMTGDIDLVKEPMKTAKELRELQGQTKEFNTVLDELAQIGKGLVISLQPFIPLLKSIMEGVQLLAPILGPALLIPILGKLRIAFAALTATMMANPWMVLAAAVAYLAQGIYYGFSPSILMVLGLLTGAFALLIPIALGMMPALVPLAAVFTGIALAVAGLASVFSTLFNSDLSSNLKIMSAEIGSIVDKINELETAKAVEFTSSVQATAVSARALAQTGATTPSAAVAAATVAPVSTGPAPTINISLSVDGTEFQTAVNSVEATNYVNGQKSALFESIVRAFTDKTMTTGGR